jgi:DEAD/DEAH box helicase domain-containing protein
VTKPTLFLYDYYPGGIGLSRKVFEMRNTVWESALSLITECSCEHGCPSCVGPPVEVGSTGKESALLVLREMRESHTG